MLNQDLNNSQQEAVMYNEGPSLVIAGAGSGKTRVLTYKIAYLLSLGMEPQSILALTFTNKAAREMKSRIAEMVGDSVARRLAMGTFHSVFSRILRTDGDKLGINSNCTVYDSNDSKNLIKKIVKEMNLDPKEYKAGAVLSRISKAKNNLVSAEAYATTDAVKLDFVHKMPFIKDIYLNYAKRCKEASAIDFDDMLFYTNILFRDYVEVREKYQELFQFILVDEYQDTNFSQHCIIRYLSEKNRKVCVVGDDAQSIYAFRGANIENILNFQKTYPEAKLFKLEENYRSTKNIVGAANSLIAKNKGQIKKSIFTNCEAGDRVKVLSAYSDTEESFIVALRAISLRKQYNYSWNDMAILYRTNSQSRIIEDAMRKHNVPYVIYGGQSFYQRKEIKDVLSYLRLIVNHSDEEAFDRIVNKPIRGIGATTLAKLAAQSALIGKSKYELSLEPISNGLVVNNGTAKKLISFATMIQQVSILNDSFDAYSVANELLLQSGILSELNANKSVENISAKENIEELLNGIYQFCEDKKEEGLEVPRLNDFLSEVALLTDMDGKEGDEIAERVTLMTVHAAKGLEYKVIFVVGVEEELFPSQFATDNNPAIEEERRLMYVALTRAEKHCTITYAKSRFKHGQTIYPKFSRFITDIDASYLDLPDRFSSRSANPDAFDFSKRNTSFFDKKRSGPSSVAPPSPHKRFVRVNSVQSTTSELNTEKSSLTSGMIIEHDRFGRGEIISIEEVAGDERMHVEFKNTGKRVLLLKFAKFRVIS